MEVGSTWASRTKNRSAGLALAIDGSRFERDAGGVDLLLLNILQVAGNKCHNDNGYERQT